MRTKHLLYKQWLWPDIKSLKFYLKNYVSQRNMIEVVITSTMNVKEERNMKVY